MKIPQESYIRYSELLQRNGITSYKVYKDTGVPQSSLSEWKRGNSVPKYDKLQKIADYFNVTIDYLLTGEEPALKEKAPDSSETVNDDAIKFALFGDKDIDDDVYDEVKRFAKYIKDKHYDTE